MTTQIDHKDRVDQEAARRRREALDRDLEREREQRLEHLLDDADAAAFQFAGQPEVLGAYLADLRDEGRVDEEELSAVVEHLRALHGDALVEQALGVAMPGPDFLAKLMTNWSESLRREQERGRVIDADAARRRKTEALLGQIARFLGLAANELRVHTDAEAERKTDARGAGGLMDGGIVYLNPRKFEPDTAEGRQILGHEVAHVAQRAEVQPAGRAAEASKGAAEAEAAGIGRAFAAGHSVGGVSQVLPAMDQAADTDAQQSTDGGADGGADRPPVEVKLNLGGQEINIRMPSMADPANVHIEDIDQEPIPGLHIDRARLRFTPTGWELRGGTLYGSLTLGESAQVDNLELEVRVGGDVQATIEGVQVTVGQYFTATMDLSVGSDGMSGQATVNPGDVQIPGGVQFTSGSLTATLANNGELSATGELTAQIQGLGTLTFTASVTPAARGGGGSAAQTTRDTPPPGGARGGGSPTLSGSVDLSLDQPITLIDGVQLTGGTVMGEYSEAEGFSMEGSVSLTMREYATTDLHARYNHTTGAWRLDGRVTQNQDISLPGGVTVTNGTLDVVFENGQFVDIAAGFDMTHEYFQGHLEGSYDFPNNELNADGEAQLTKELTLGQTGVVIKELGGRAEIVASAFNELSEIHGRAEVPYQGQPTFEVTFEDGRISMEPAEVSGTGTVTTMRELTFGNAEKMHATIAQGASASVTVEQNTVTAINSGIAFTVSEPAGEVGTGTLTLNFQGAGGAQGARGAQGGSVSGEGTFTLTQDYGVPDRQTGPLVLKQGGSITAIIADSALKSISVEGVEFEVRNPATGQPGIITGTVSSGSYDFETSKLNLEAEAVVTENWPLVGVSWGEGLFSADTTITGVGVRVSVVESELKTLGGFLPFEAHISMGGKAIDLKGRVGGDYDVPSGQLTGYLEAALVNNDLEIDVGDSGDKVVIKKDVTKARAEVSGNGLEQVTFEAAVDYVHGGQVLLEGAITEGAYKVADGTLSFQGDLTLKQRVERQLGEGGAWKLVVLPNATTVHVEVTDNSLTKMGGSIGLQVHEGDTPMFEGSLTNADLDLSGEQPVFSGELSVSTLQDFSFPRPASGATLPPRLQLTAKTGSTVTGTITENQLSAATITLDFAVSVDGTEAGTGRVSGSWDAETDKVSGTGAFDLTRDVDVATGRGGGGAQEPAGWKLQLAEGSHVDIAMVDSALSESSVNVTVKLVEGEEEVATGNITGTYTFGDEAGYSGAASFAMSKDYKLTTAGRFDIYLGQDTSVSATATDSRLTSATGDFVLAAKMAGAQETAMKLTVNTTYQEGQGFSGAASIDVLQPIRIGQAEPYSVWLDPATKGTVTVTNNEPQAFDGDITISVSKGENQFARAEAKLDYDFTQGEGAKVDFDGTIELIGELPLGTAAGTDFTLKGGSNLHAKLVQNDLKQVDGQLVLGAAKGTEGEFATLTITGVYDATGEQPFFNGTAEANITRKFALGYEAFGYSFHMMPSSVTVTLTDSEITSASGSIVFAADQAGGEDQAPLGSLIVTLQGDYLKPQGQAQGTFNGTGRADVQGQLHVGDAGDYEFYVEGGSGVEVDVEDNKFTRLHGQLTARVDQKTPGAGEDKQFLRIATEVTYIPDEGGKIDANGSAAMLGRKKILDLNGYQFWLVQGQGGNVATVDIKDNVLNEVGGTVSCAVYDGPVDQGPLIVAHAQGTWKRETNLFSGSGDIRLGRDVTFPEGAGEGQARLIFREGSGGNAEVKNNEIRKLGGSLTVTIADAQGEVVEVTANGTYNAVTNVLEELTGSATLKRNIEIGGTGDNALFTITSLTGTATIKNNELKGVSGSLDFTLPRFKNMTGHIEGGWRLDESGESKYWGTGKLNFQLIDDQRTGRKLGGEIDATFNEDGTWVLDGEVQYNINKILGGTVGVHVDQELNPVLRGTLEATNVTLVEGRELFSMDFPLLPDQSTSLGYGFFLNYGIRGGMGMGLAPLKIDRAAIVVDNFRPLDNDAGLPDFEIPLQLSWGMDFNAFLAAYLDISAGPRRLGVGAGVEGLLQLNAPLRITPHGTIGGGSRGFWGELGIGISLAPTLSLSATPYVRATLGSQEARAEMDPWNYEFGDLFRWEWSTSYKWGDQGTSKSAGPGAQPVGTPAAHQSEATKEQAQSQQVHPTNGGAGANVDGGPQLESKAEMDQQAQPAGGGGPMAQIQQKINQIETIAKGIAGAAFIVGEIQHIATAAAFGAAAGVGVYLAWKYFTDKGYFQRLEQSIRDVIAAVNEIIEIIRPHLPSWWDAVIDFFTGDRPSIFDALFGADDRMREAVANGDHRYLPPDGRANMIKTMLDGYCGDADEDAILVVMRYSASKGDLRAVLSHVKGNVADSVDRILWKLDGSQDTAARRIFDAAGIDY